MGEQESGAIIKELPSLLDPPHMFRTRQADLLWAYLVPHLPTAFDAGFVSKVIESIEWRDEAWLRAHIGPVIDRWHRAGLLRFNSHDDGSDDLLLRDEIAHALIEEVLDTELEKDHAEI